MKHHLFFRVMGTLFKKWEETWLHCTCEWQRTPSVYAAFLTANHGYSVQCYLQIITPLLEMLLRLGGFGSVIHAGLMPMVVPNTYLLEQANLSSIVLEWCMVVFLSVGFSVEVLVFWTSITLSTCRHTGSLSQPCLLQLLQGRVC